MVYLILSPTIDRAGFENTKINPCFDFFEILTRTARNQTWACRIDSVSLDKDSFAIGLDGLVVVKFFFVRNNAFMGLNQDILVWISTFL